MTPLNLKSFGATGVADDTAAIAKALAVGKAQRQPVIVPAGTWNYSDVLNVDGIELYGEEGATLHSLNTDRAAIFLRGTDVGVRGLRLTGVAPAKRTSPYETTRVAAIGAVGFWIEDVTIESGSGAGIAITRASKNGRIERNRVSGTLADAIHVTDRSSFVTILDNTIERAGDDGIAVVSYRSQSTPCNNITAHHNRISANVGGRCMSVVGGSDVLYEFNELRGNAGGAGLYLAQEKAYDTLALKNITARRNTIANCGNKAIGHFAVMLFANAEKNENVRLERNLIVQDGVRGGLRVYGDQVGIALDSNVCSNAAPAEQIVTPNVLVTPYAGGAVGVQ